MALNLTEGQITLKGLPVKALLKVPESMIKGKRIYKIRKDQLLNMKLDRKEIIHPEARRVNAISPVKPGRVLQTHVKHVEQDISRVEVSTSQNPVENNAQLTSFIPEPQPSTQQNPSEPIVIEEQSVTEQESELDKIKRELEETKMQVKHLREQFLKKEKEAFEYKRIIQLLNKT